MSLIDRRAALLGLTALTAGCANVPQSYALRSQDRASLIRRYRTPASKFVTLDGVEVHYTDAGSGPAVFLMHGNLGSMRMYADWIKPLTSAGYRVIAMDFPANGLTGPNREWERAEPRESMDRNIVLVQGLMDHLSVDRAAMVATSFTGIVAYRIAARFPQRAPVLVLMNSGGLPRTPQTDPNRPQGTAQEQAIRRHYFPKESMRSTLRRLLPPERPPSEALIQEYYDLQNMRGRQNERARLTPTYRSGDVAGTLARVRQPTLILWGDYPGLLDVGQATQFQSLLVNAPVTLKTYPGVGHLIALEAPERCVADVLSFLKANDWGRD